MPEITGDTTATPDGTADPDASAAADATARPSGEGDGDVSTLKSRLSGQTAKVNVLTGEKQALKDQLAEAQRLLDEARKGTTSADEAAKALVAQANEELAKERRATQLARIEAKYPEVFGELGEAASALNDTQLAAMEVRLRGEGATEAPTPRGNNGAREGAAAKVPAERTSEDILAELRSMPAPDWWPTQD